MHLQHAMASTCGETLEPLASLAILAILVEVRRAWAVKSVFKAWAAQVQSAANKLIRGRPMQLPERVGVEGLDPIEQSYKIYYYSELKSHVVDQVRQAAGRAIGSHPDLMARPRAGTPQFLLGDLQDQDHASASSRSSSKRRRSSAQGPRTGDPVSMHKEDRDLNALQRWIRAATPPDGLRRTHSQANAPPEPQDRGQDSSLSREQEDPGGSSVLRKFEEERRRHEEQVGVIVVVGGVRLTGCVPRPRRQALSL
jgi:hypothetical protein